MSQPRKQANRAKPNTFGSVLRAAIVTEFGTNKAFAKALGVTPGRISQIIGAPVDVDPKTLAGVLSAFSSVALQTEVHAAWVREFVPLPRVVLDSMESKEAAHQSGELWQADLPRQALEIAMAHRAKVKDPVLWQELSGLAVLVNLRMGRPGAALRVLSEMEKRSKADSEPEHLLTALWMKGSALRNVEGIPIQHLDQVHRDALHFAYSELPKGKGRERWLTKRLELARDYALHVLAVNELRPVAKEALNHAWKGVDEAITRWDDERAATMGLEVRARVEVALGQSVKADDTISEVLARDSGDILELHEKLALVKARIAIERRQIDEAKALLMQISDTCLAKMNLHHYRVADQLLARLEAGVLPHSRPQ